jgi:flagellar assembly factor FliW
MPSCQTKFHGALTFEPEQVLRVPQGLFGFTDETEFLLLELPSSRPVVFVQSVRSANLCFIALPVQVIDADYRLTLDTGTLSTLGYAEDAAPRMGKELLCVALLTIGERSATANLVAPLVIDIASHRGAQLMVEGYSYHQPLSTPGLQPQC